jgi:uncharacterized membrane protein AbrB (regulator of aidB expression)
VRTVIGGFGLTVFAVAIVLTPFAMFTDWPTPFIFIVIDAVALFAWAQAIQMRSGLSWARTYEWIAVFIGIVLAMAVYFGVVSLVSRIVLGSLLAIVGYVLFVVAAAWGFGWVMGDARRARAFLALRRVLMGSGIADDVRLLELGPRAYR